MKVKFTWDTAATSFGFLMTGRYDYGLEGSNLLHYSTDGTHWQTCATPRSRGGTAANFTEIALLEDTLVILESETGVLHTWKRPKRIEDERP